jgi:hypothetical protein
MRRNSTVGEARAMPTRLTHLVVDTPGSVALARWWADALGWVVESEDPEESYVVPPAGAAGVPLVFGLVDDPKAGKNRVHLDLAPTAVERLVESGATYADVGQGDVPWTVLADPDGNEFCVLEPRDGFGDTGTMAAIVHDAVDPAALAAFWVAASGWQVADVRERTTILRAPSGDGPLLAFVKTDEPHRYKNRIHLDVAGYADDDRDAEVARLMALGATPADVGQGDDPEITWVVLADPEGNEFCVLRSR